MNHWHRTSAAGQTLQIEFVPGQDRFWSPDNIARQPLDARLASGGCAVLSGPGSVWMYAHAAATLRAGGASSLEIERFPQADATDDPAGSRCELRSCAGGAALLTIHLRPNPPLSDAAIERLLSQALDELAQQRPEVLVIRGRASVDVYARIAWEAVENGVRELMCWSARDGLIVVFDRNRVADVRSTIVPSWLRAAISPHKQSVVLGVAGDPNRGKSTFSLVIDWYREQLGVEGWRLDADGQSPTPPWYFSLRSTSPSQADKLRNIHKRPWTAEMEVLIADQIRRSREIFDLLIVDLPGGNHKVTPPIRIPPGREKMFKELDMILLLGDDRDPSAQSWREALRPHGLESKVVAVLTSRDPHGTPLLNICSTSRPMQGQISGLDRARAVADLGRAYRHALDRLWSELQL